MLNNTQLIKLYIILTVEHGKLNDCAVVLAVNVESTSCIYTVQEPFLESGMAVVVQVELVVLALVVLFVLLFF